MIHLLGPGAVGCLVASNLAPRFPVTAILKSVEQLQKYKQADEKIRVEYRGATVETHVPGIAASEPPSSIQHLVVTTKAHQTVNALRSLQGSIGPESTILLLHNGMGLHEEIKSRLWPSPGSRPAFMFGVTTTGVRQAGAPWSYSMHGSYPLIFSSPDTDVPASATYLTNAFLESSKLFLSENIPYPDFVIAQLQKLVVNACINPLTAILDCRNGRLLELDQHRLCTRIVRETAKIIHSYVRTFEPEISSELSAALSEERLGRVVEDAIKRTANNTSSMLADVLAVRPTEVDYINGYLCKLGRKAEVSFKYNEMLLNLVKMKSAQVAWEVKNQFMPLQFD